MDFTTVSTIRKNMDNLGKRAADIVSTIQAPPDQETEPTCDCPPSQVSQSPKPKDYTDKYELKCARASLGFMARSLDRNSSGLEENRKSIKDWKLRKKWWDFIDSKKGSWTEFSHQEGVPNDLEHSQKIRESTRKKDGLRYRIELDHLNEQCRQLERNIPRDFIIAEAHFYLHHGPQKALKKSHRHSLPALGHENKGNMKEVWYLTDKPEFKYETTPDYYSWLAYADGQEGTMPD
ncbi:uncharacterized protein KY384_005634 [Bacidia gigantensis]|uniref:uncharacterized protein n=1 Tax=Bacidia gigantensis TaxID=2732470 RepID=UPI001D042273|nr:uncharacterized protein KY384_005634 [Bacidia gigantensis]KAG8530151.1 hypothetical protein KY384_005634 [Bacidia gigantensis]